MEERIKFTDYFFDGEYSKQYDVLMKGCAKAFDMGEFGIGLEIFKEASKILEKLPR